MRIAFLVGQFPALSETFVLDQITSLISRGHSVSIFAERRPEETEEHPDVARFDLRRRTRYEAMPDGFLPRALRLPAVLKPDLRYLRAMNVARFGRAAASLRLAWSVRLFDGEAPFDIIQCHFGALGLKAVLLRSAGALSGKIVTAFHGEDIVNYPRRFFGNVYAPLFAGGDMFLPISARWNDPLIALGCPPSRIRIHRMGINAGVFAADAGKDGASDRPFRVVSVSRLVEKKGIADAIRAVARLPGVCEYVIAGDGPERARLEHVAIAEGISRRVRFAGAQARNDVIQLLRSADVFVAPSVTAADGDIEGIPVCIMEAMASGLPVVATRHSAIPELVADGESGFLVEEHDVAGLTERLSRLARDPGLRIRMGTAGAAIVEREFEINMLVARLEGLYGEVLSGVSDQPAGGGFRGRSRLHSRPATPPADPSGTTRP